MDGWPVKVADLEKMGRQLWKKGSRTLPSSSTREVWSEDRKGRGAGPLVGARFELNPKPNKRSMRHHI